MLDDNVVAAAEDIDLCMILGAAWPFHAGGATPYLDRVGASERVFGATFHDPRIEGPRGLMSKAHDAAALSRCLADAGYTREGVSAFLGPIAWDALARISPAPAKAICEREQAHPLSALVRAFWLGQPVEADALAAALTHAGASAAEGLRLVATDGERATPLVTLRSVSVSTGAREHEFLVASDRDELCGVSPCRITTCSGSEGRRAP